MALARRSLVLVVLSLALVPATTHAASYDVWSCNLLDGTNLPAEGWTAQKYGATASAGNNCKFSIGGTDNGFGGGFSGNAAPGDYAGWTFTAPTDTTISGYTLWRAARAVSSSDAFQDYILSHEVRADARVAVPGPVLQRLRVVLRARG